MSDGLIFFVAIFLEIVVVASFLEKRLIRIENTLIEIQGELGKRES